MNTPEAISQYCKDLDAELITWKARLYDVVVKVDEEKRTTGAQYSETVSALQSTVNDLEKHIKYMDAECPMDMNAEQERINHLLENLQVHYTKAISLIGTNSDSD